MATNPTTTEYAETLKTIKEREEATNREIAEKKKYLDAELQRIQDENSRAITQAKKDAEIHVAQEVDKEKSKAEQQAAKLVESAGKEAEKIVSKKLRDSELKRIVDSVLLSEFQDG